MTDILSQYFQLVCEGRYATADLLRAELPDVKRDMVCPPDDERDSFSCFGSIVLTEVEFEVDHSV